MSKCPPLFGRIAIVEDPDTKSRVPGEDLWTSRLRYGSLTIPDNPELQEPSLVWGREVELRSSLGAGGRGMELSELVVHRGHLLTLDDRTGVVYRVRGDGVVPWVILADGDGTKTKGLKAEWATVGPGGDLWVGGLGKEWTSGTGELVNKDPMWVKVVSGGGEVRHLDWSRRYEQVRHCRRSSRRRSSRRCVLRQECLGPDT